MSRSSSSTEEHRSEPRGRIERLREIRDTVEALAESDLPVAEDCQRYLDQMDEQAEGDDA